MNEWYAKDISKKIRSAYKTKALKGEFTASFAPYGYIKDPNDKHHLLIDLDVIDVVRTIFIKASKLHQHMRQQAILRKIEY